MIFYGHQLHLTIATPKLKKNVSSYYFPSTLAVIKFLKQKHSRVKQELKKKAEMENFIKFMVNHPSQDGYIIMFAQHFGHKHHPDIREFARENVPWVEGSVVYWRKYS